MQCKERQSLCPLEIWTEKQEKEAWEGREDRPGSKEGKALWEGRLGKKGVCRWGFEEQLLSNRGFASCQLSWSRAGQETQWDEMLRAMHRVVCLLLIPPPLRYGALKCSPDQSHLFSLFLAHNNPAIQSKKAGARPLRVPCCRHCLSTSLSLPASYILKVQPASRHPSLQDRLTALPW